VNVFAFYYSLMVGGGATLPSLTSHRNAAAFTRRAFALLK
jgi:hypothetical protein